MWSIGQFPNPRMELVVSPVRCVHGIMYQALLQSRCSALYPTPPQDLRRIQHAGNWSMFRSKDTATGLCHSCQRIKQWNIECRRPIIVWIMSKRKNYKILSNEIRRRGRNVIRERYLVFKIFRLLPDMKCSTFLTPDSGRVTTPLEFYFINKPDLMILHALFA